MKLTDTIALYKSMLLSAGNLIPVSGHVNLHLLLAYRGEGK